MNFCSKCTDNETCSKFFFFSLLKNKIRCSSNFLNPFTKKCEADCPAGFYKELNNCLNCSLSASLNKYCDDCENENKCIKCHAYFLNTSSFKCVKKCDPGEVGNVLNSECEPCDPSCKYCTEKEDSTKCTECEDAN